MKDKAWWNPHLQKNKGLLKKQIGPLSIALKRNNSDWQLYFEHSEIIDTLETSLNISIDINDDNLRERFFYTTQQGVITFIPLLADRPVVSKPAKPLTIPAKLEATIYVSTPLWVGIHIGEPAILIKEIPILRPSDTWFGPNTLSGELCYSSKTSARLSVSELPKRPYRATTPILIRNESEEHLLIDRVNLPVPFLSLYENDEGLLWTESVMFTKTEDAEKASLKIIDGPPSEISKAALLAKPRQNIKNRTIINKISSFFA